MKSLALENYGVQEMSYQEQNETDGGLIWLAFIAVALLASSCYSTAPSTPLNGGMPIKSDTTWRDSTNVK